MFISSGKLRQDSTLFSTCLRLVCLCSSLARLDVPWLSEVRQVSRARSFRCKNADSIVRGRCNSCVLCDDRNVEPATAARFSIKSGN